MNKEQALKTYIEFYTDEENINKIWNSAHLCNKEFAFYNKHFEEYKMKRHFSIRTKEFMKNVIQFNCVSWCKKGINKMYNLYYTMAEYKELYPNMAYMLRNKHIRWDFNTMLTKIKHIPLVIDLDSDSLEDLKVHAKDVYKICEHLEKPMVIFTGMGFHIYDDEIGKKFNNDLTMHTEFVTELAESITEFIDLKIYDYRRILKIPNSLAVYEDDNENFKMFIVSEIELNELKDFKYVKYEIG